MPFDPIPQPSIGLSLLKAVLAPLNISTKICYLSLRFAELVGTSLYDWITAESAPSDLIGEWVFASELFHPDQFDEHGYIEDVLRRGLPAHRPSVGSPGHNGQL